MNFWVISVNEDLSKTTRPLQIIRLLSTDDAFCIETDYFYFYVILVMHECVNVRLSGIHTWHEYGASNFIINFVSRKINFCIYRASVEYDANVHRDIINALMMSTIRPNTQMSGLSRIHPRISSSLPLLQYQFEFFFLTFNLSTVICYVQDKIHRCFKRIVIVT